MNVVKKVMNDLLNYGKVQRALLGVQIQDINTELADREKLKSLDGVYINKVFENSAASDAGIKSGDILVGVEGSEIKTTAMLQEKLSQYGPGEKIKVSLKREGNGFLVSLHMYVNIT